MPGPTIICVDPDESDRAATLDRLRSEARDPTLLEAETLAGVEEPLRERAVDCVVTEYHLPDGTGLDVADRVRELRPSAGCVLFTRTDRAAFDTETHADAVTEYVSKDAADAADAADRLWNLVEFTSTFRVQTAYPLPQDETDRLAALDSYEFDSEDLRADVERVTDLAAKRLDVPMASVNLIKEHSQEFLVCHGADWTPTAREQSICTYAIADEGTVTAVEDVKEDPRFAENESLDDLGIRSYLGADLTTGGGLSIGTLCAYDGEPHTFSADDREFLDRLADVTMSILDLHLEVTQLRDGPDDAPASTVGSDGS
ncbi:MULTISPECIES: GAF domain-containing protein [Halorussus]|uniref:GAF domain-containing protein n=1 Tax=Halorussus TaxID=1070314 RepID=UPI000E218D16|nr:MULTISPECIES: GAF domain-containing protein [Halorussus]NHN58246.1 GAF domain-containing protein [Halorussus sp. JP-T4]